MRRVSRKSGGSWEVVGARSEESICRLAGSKSRERHPTHYCLSLRLLSSITGSQHEPVTT